MIHNNRSISLPSFPVSYSYPDPTLQTESIPKSMDETKIALFNRNGTSKSSEESHEEDDMLKVNEEMKMSVERVSYQRWRAGLCTPQSSSSEPCKSHAFNENDRNVKVPNEPIQENGKGNYPTVLWKVTSQNMKKSISSTDLHSKSQTVCIPYFPSTPRRPDSGKQKGLKDSVINDMCRAVVKHMVGDIYVVSTYEKNRYKKVVNHLYEPMLKKVQQHFRKLPARYALSVNPDDVPLHMKLLSQHQKHSEEISIHGHWLTADEENTSTENCEVIVVAKDQDHLLDAITRSLASMKGNIIDADVMTTKDGYTLDRFTVKGNFVDENRINELKRRVQKNIMIAVEEKSPARSIAKSASFLPEQLPPPPAPPLVNSDSTGEITSQESMNRYKDIQQEWKIEFNEISFGRPIGTGRTGTTYLASWRGIKVAAKLINLQQNLEKDANEEILNDFHREMTVVSRLRHPNIVLFLGAARKSPTYGLIFEFMENGTLTDVLRDRNMAIDFFKIATEIAMGMNYLHLCSIIHRDLKSGNVLIDANGTVKVSDFGLSCVFDGGAGDLTAETGTYRWMAPEVIRHEPYSNKIDVYSYGIVLWEMIVREQPFKGLTPIQAAFAVARQCYRPMLPPCLPSSLGELVRRCWHQDPFLRPSFKEILEILPVVRSSMTKKDLQALNFL